MWSVPVSHDLGEALTAAAGRSSDAGETARRIGLAYVRFAVENPQRFRLLSLHRSQRTLQAEGELDPDVTSAWDRFGRQVLVDAFARGQAAGVIAPGDPQILALSAWALVHGLATLLLNGLLTDGPPTADEAAELTDQAAVVLGLGLFAR